MLGNEEWGEFPEKVRGHPGEELLGMAL